MVQTNCINKKAIIICGPTASGKTALAVECAKLLGSEVISADSMYLYKGLNIGTAKPTIDEMCGVPHHMIDIAEPNDCFSVSDYKRMAEPVLEKLFVQNKVPIICGGTGFYINSLLYDLSYGNGSANMEARERYRKLAEKFGNKYVYDILIEKDPDTAAKLHFNDVKRVIRALEIFENGQVKSKINDDYTPKFDAKAYMINHARSDLYERINKRVDLMINTGLVDEVRNLINEGYDRNCQCFQGIGYKEVVEFLFNESTLSDAIEKIKLNTRHYAKRQITFFKKMHNLIVLEPGEITNLAKRIVNEL